MTDDFDILGVLPSDRKKLESMGITKIEQIAVLSPRQLGLGKSKSEGIIRRAHNIIANKSIEDIEIGEKEIRVKVKSLTKPVKKSVLSVLGVYDIHPGSIAVSETRDTIHIFRKSPAFSKIVENAEIQKSIIEERKRTEMLSKGVTLDVEEIKEFAINRGFEGFWRNVFSEIKGNEIMKKSLSVSLFSTFEEPVHSLIIGEPGSSKTLAKELIETTFKDISVIGANTTRAGLVCNLGTGDLGALAYSNNRIVLIDEFDKIPESDIEYCYELLSNGRCSVHSSKIHTEIESHFIMIAFANPREGVFRRKPIEEIPLPPILISRFALIVKTEEISEEDRKALFKEKFYGRSEVRIKSSYYDQWLKVARDFIPEIKASERDVDRYIDKASRIVEIYQSTKLRRDLRMGDYIRRIPLSIARASFKDVDTDVLKESEEIIEESISSWEEHG